MRSFFLLAIALFSFTPARAGMVGGVSSAVILNAIPLSITYYVDKNRTDTYTATGSFVKPFKTIQGAFNAIATAAIPDAFVDIIGPGYYAENVVINAPSLGRLVVDGHKGVNIQPASGLAWDWSTNNAAMDISTVWGINFRGPVNIVGSTDGVTIWATDNAYRDCQFDQLVTVKNVVGVEFNNSYLVTGLALENIGDGAAFLLGGHGLDPGTTLSIVSNPAHAKPAGFSSSLFVADGCRMGASITMDSGSGIQTRNGVRVGSPGDTFTVNGTYTAYQSWVRADIVVPNGGTFLARGTGWEGSLTVNAGGSFTNSFDAKQVAFTPTTSGNWSPVPTTVFGALDTLAALKPASFLPLSTGTLTGIVANEIVGSGKTVRAMTIENLVASATLFTCAVNPVLTLLDCGTSAGACTSGTTTLGSVTLTAVNTLTAGTVSNASIAAGHYWAWEVTAGTCTALSANGTSEAIMQ